MEEPDLREIFSEIYLASKPRWNAIVAVLEQAAIECIMDDETADYVLIPMVKTKEQITEQDLWDAQIVIQDHIALGPDALKEE